MISCSHTSNDLLKENGDCMFDCLLKFSVFIDLGRCAAQEKARRKSKLFKFIRDFKCVPSSKKAVVKIKLSEKK